jgi:hypothetical protein
LVRRRYELIELCGSAQESPLTDTGKLMQYLRRVGDMLGYLVADYVVESASGEGQSRGVCTHERPVPNEATFTVSDSILNVAIQEDVGG